MSGPARLTIAAMLATAAAALSLAAVFHGTAWVAPVLVAVALVAAAQALVRHSPLPSVFGPLLAALAVLCWLTGRYAHQDAWLGFIPDGASMQHLGRLTRAGFDDIHRLATPVPTHPGMVLVATVGVAAVALLVDLLAVTLRRAAVAGLPLLALYATCAGIARNGAELLEFMVGAAGFLLLLYADNRERVRRWGRSLGESRAEHSRAWTPGTTARAPAAMGRRIGAATIGLGAVVPFLVPGLHAGMHRQGHEGSGGHGGNVVTVNPIVSVAADLTSRSAVPVLRYTSTSTDPGYLRLTSLDSFNGSTFSAPTLVAPPTARVGPSLPGSPQSGVAVTTRITVGHQLSVHWLPAPARVRGVQVGGDWRYDPDTATVFSASDATQGLRYVTTSVTPAVTAAQLTSAGSATAAASPDLALPAHEIPPAVAALTDRVTAGATSEYQAALDIQRFLTSSRFSYDTHVRPATGPNALADFLLHARRGFCQQFATAMAVMARQAGIPARVAVGFTPGTRQPDGSWLVTTHDAHAWPELYFNRYGWLAFEPTPRADGQTSTPAYAVPAGHGAKAAGAAVTHTRTPRSTPRAKSGISGTARNSSDGLVKAGSNGGGTGWRTIVGLVVATLVVLALLLPALVRVVIRRRRRYRLQGDPDAAWAELRDTAEDLGVAWPVDRTPRETGRALARDESLDEPARSALRTLVLAEERRRYAAAPDAVTDLAPVLDQVTHALRERRSRARRVMALVLPHSTLRRLREWAAGAATWIGERIRRRTGRLTGRGVPRPSG